MSRLLAGKPVADALRAEVAAGVRELVAAGLRPPGLAVVLVGEDPASQVYVGSKVRACGEAGIRGRNVRLHAGTSEAELASVLDELNADEAIDGVLLQLPLPGALRGAERRLLERIAPDKDVDGFHPVNVGRLWVDDERAFAPATPTGVIELLRRSGIPLGGARAVVVGRSNIVGKPMAALLLRENATVTLCHSRTRDLAAVTRQADLLIAALGRPGFLGAEHVREGAVVVDVGVNRLADRAALERLYPPGSEGREERLAQLETRGYTLVGDVDFTAVAPKVAAITPVPGGVGVLTVAALLANTLKASRLRQGLPAESAKNPETPEIPAARAEAVLSAPAPGQEVARRRPLTVGLTGGLASGKSSVARWLAEAGFRMVDADGLVAELHRPGGAGAEAVRRLFGEPYLDPKGGVDHAKVADRVFADPAARRALEQAIHPLVRQRFEEIVRTATEPVVVLEATLLVEAGFAPAFDCIVTVEAPEEIRLRRAIERGMNEAAARARLLAQGDGAARRAAAHRILDNSCDLPYLRRQLDELIDELTRLARQRAR